MGRSRDIAKFLSSTEAENTNNNALLHTGSSVGVDSAQVQNIGVASYDTLDSLPISNLVAGQQAFVKDARRLYVSNGSGWFNTAVANATPRWDSGGEPDAEYTIADSATPLIITARAIDSDNSDRNLLNQSFGTDSALYMVDITNDSSIFTFTPRSADSIGIEVANGNLTDSNGDFIYTFKWSDGINFVSKAVTITYNVVGGGGADATGWINTVQFTTNNNSVTPELTVYAATQDKTTGDYYVCVQDRSSIHSTFIIKFNEDGSFAWGREIGSYYLRLSDIVVDGSSNIYAFGSDYGWGENNGSPSPQCGYVIKFNSSGTKQWSKIIKYTNLTTNSMAVDLLYGDVDSYGNLWIQWYYYTDGSGNNIEAQPALIKISPTGSLEGSWRIPSNYSSTTFNAQDGLNIDENDNLYYTFRQYDPNVSNPASPHAGIMKLSIPASGSPTLDYTYLYGRDYGSAHYESAYNIRKTSDGNLILVGYTVDNGSSPRYPFVMKVSATNGSIIWQKRLDNTFFSDFPYGIWTIDNNDRIWIKGQTASNGNHYIRIFDGDDGSQISTYQITFDAGNTPYIQNNGGGGKWMFTNKDGNVVWAFRTYQTGPITKVCLLKFPSDIITGTFGLLNIASSSAPTDTNFTASLQTYATYSVASNNILESVNYNSGTQNDNISNQNSPSVEDFDAIS